MGQWLRLHASTAGGWGPPLVGELGFHVLVVWPVSKNKDKEKVLLRNSFKKELLFCTFCIWFDPLKFENRWIGDYTELCPASPISSGIFLQEKSHPGQGRGRGVLVVIME